MNYYSIPADFKKETIDKYAEINKEYKESRINDTYGNVTLGDLLGSGRPAYQIPDIDLSMLKDYITYSAKFNIDFAYTINTTFTNEMEFTKEGLSQLIAFIQKLFETGVRTLIITLPSLIELINSLNLGFKIKGSTLCSITNPNKAKYFKELGLDKIVVDESINKDFPKLERIIKVFGSKVELIVNTHCFKECVYRPFHYDQLSLTRRNSYNEISASYYDHRCLFQHFNKVHNLLKLGWIRPEDINLYNKIGIHYFKLQGRQAVFKGNMIKAIHHYFKQDYDGDLFDLINIFEKKNSFKIKLNNKRLDGFLEAFYSKKVICKNDCDSCRYCETFAKKIIDYNEADKTIKMAHDFYKEYDQFNQLITESQVDNKLIKNKIHADPNIEDKGDFEFGE